MDSRLFKINGFRPARLRRKDLPAVTKAIIAVLRKRATIGSGFTQGVGFVEIKGKEQNVLILKEDWAKILPFIQNNTLDPKLTPAAACVGYLDPRIAYDESVIDRADRFLYGNLLGLLRRLFPEEFPTA